MVTYKYIFHPTRKPPSGLTPRLRGDGYNWIKRAVWIKKSVRTYAPFERGWLLMTTCVVSGAVTLVSGLTPRLRGDGYPQEHEPR